MPVFDDAVFTVRIKRELWERAHKKYPNVNDANLLRMGLKTLIDQPNLSSKKVLIFPEEVTDKWWNDFGKFAKKEEESKERFAFKSINNRMEKLKESIEKVKK